MPRCNTSTLLRYGQSHLSHAGADWLARQALRAKQAQRVLLCLSETEDASTAALARLILLRRSLLTEGRDVVLLGLRGRARALYEVSRLSGVLPSLPLEREAELLLGAGVGGCAEVGWDEGEAPEAMTTETPPAAGPHRHASETSSTNGHV